VETVDTVVMLVPVFREIALIHHKPCQMGMTIQRSNDPRGEHSCVESGRFGAEVMIGTGVLDCSAERF
jgi:hypothetical protein